MVRVLLQLYLCYSYARNRGRIHVLLLDSFCPNYRGFHPRDADVPFLRLRMLIHMRRTYGFAL